MLVVEVVVVTVVVMLFLKSCCTVTTALPAPLAPPRLMSACMHLCSFTPTVKWKRPSFQDLILMTDGSED